MNISLLFLRLFFAILSLIFMTTFMVARPDGFWVTNALFGIVIGSLFTLLLIGVDRLVRNYHLRSFNVTILGLLIGYLMGQLLVMIFNAILDLTLLSDLLKSHTLEMVKVALFLFGTYLGAVMTLRCSSELYISIPFVKFASTGEKKRDILIDSSVLSDTRIIDLCLTGILNQHLVIPRFIVKELYLQVEVGDELTKNRAKRSLDAIKKMEQIPELGLRFNESDFPEVKESSSKLIRLARLIDANIFTADISRVEMASIEGVQMINLHRLSTALKPLMQTGELIKIKVQRYGKEPRQGVGYLDDGTMVVINGGGNYIGEIIEAKVLSVKHTSSGRIVFSNAPDDDTSGHESDRESSYGDEENE